MTPALGEDPVYAETNVAKYEDKNPITSRLVGRFTHYCLEKVAARTSQGSRILDVGVSEGTMTAFLAQELPDRKIVATEVEPEGCAKFHDMHPTLPLIRGSVYHLPFAANSFDLVTGFEVLEHLKDPRAALMEMERVSRGDILVSVPYEPFFRAGNIARGKHLTRLGNTPGHINHWGARSLGALMRSVFPSVEVSRPFPWLLARGSSGPRR